jgi:hypothetical protein
MNKSSPGGAVEVICRIEEGDFLGASTLTVSRNTDPAKMEAIAYREALALVQGLMLHKVTIASDCMEIIQALNNGFDGSFRMVIKEVKAIARLLAEVSF